jgi:hypothetical protein
MVRNPNGYTSGMASGGRKPVRYSLDLLRLPTFLLSWNRHHQRPRLNIEPVYDTWDGIYDEGVVRMGDLINTQYTADLGPGEGYVVRVKAAFHESMAPWRIAKYVRANHVTTSKHWMQQQLTVNKLRVDMA